MTTIKLGSDTYFDFLEYLLQHEESKEDEDEEIMIVFLAASNLQPLYNVCDQLDWDSHVAKLFQEGPLAFYCQYRMGYASFVKLCSLVDPFVRFDPLYSSDQTGKTPIIVLHCLLRWLAGGSYLGIRV